MARITYIKDSLGPMRVWGKPFWRAAHGEKVLYVQRARDGFAVQVGAVAQRTPTRWYWDASALKGRIRGYGLGIVHVTGYAKTRVDAEKAVLTWVKKLGIP